MYKKQSNYHNNNICFTPILNVKTVVLKYTRILDKNALLLAQQQASFSPFFYCDVVTQYNLNIFQYHLL